MKIKTFVAATLASLVAASFSCVADPVFQTVDDTSAAMQNSTESAPASAPANVGSSNGQSTNSSSDSTSNNNDDMSADTATGDDDY